MGICLKAVVSLAPAVCPPPATCHLPPATTCADAVGMGLNLAIRRVVFTSLRKFDGAKERLLTAAEIKQVGGVWSAGRPQLEPHARTMTPHPCS